MNELDMYETNYHNNSVFRKNNQEFEGEVRNLQKSYWHKRFIRHGTGQVDPKIAEQSSEESDDDKFEFDKVEESELEEKKVDNLGLNIQKTTGTRSIVSNAISKGTHQSSNLDYMDGDITITDKYGVIRGTFTQNHINSTLQSFNARQQSTDGPKVDLRHLYQKPMQMASSVVDENEEEQWEVIQGKNEKKVRRSYDLKRINSVDIKSGDPFGGIETNAAALNNQGPPLNSKDTSEKSDDFHSVITMTDLAVEQRLYK